MLGGTFLLFGGLFVCAISGSVGRQLSRAELHRLPKIFHLDDYNRCLTQDQGIYCLGTFELTGEETHPALQLIREHAKDRFTFNRTLLRRGYCVNVRCPDRIDIERNTHDFERDTQDFERDTQDFERDTQDFERNIQRFERCVSKYARRFSLTTRLRKLDYCTTHAEYRERLNRPPNNEQWMYVYAVAFVLLLNVLGTIYDYWNYSKGNSLVLAWSFRVNWARFTRVDESALMKTLSPLQFTRQVLQWFAMLAHTMLIYFGVYTQNPEELETLFHGFMGTLIRNGTSLVQIFILISCFLTGLNFLMFASKSTNEINAKILFKWTLKRIVRILPAYLVVLGYVITWWPHAVEGPLWLSVVHAENRICRRKFWSQVLFINNVVEAGDLCLVQSWGLAIDMQLYLVSLFTSYFIMKKQVNAKRILAALFGLSALLNVLLAYFAGWEPMVKLIYPENLRVIFRETPSFPHIHMSLYANLQTCFLGILMAHICFDMMCKKSKTQANPETESLESKIENEIVENGVAGNRQVQNIVEGNECVRNGSLCNDFIQNGLIQNGVVSNELVRNKVERNGFVRNGVLSNGHVKNGVVSNGNVQNGVASNGIIQNGDVSNGSVENGVLSNGSVQNKVVSNGRTQNGLLSSGSFQNGLASNGQVQKIVKSNGFNKNGVVSKGTVQNGVVSNGSIENGVVSNESVQNEVLSKGTIQNGVDSNGSVQNGVVSNGNVENGVVSNVSIENGVDSNYTIQNGVVGYGSVQNGVISDRSVQSGLVSNEIIHNGVLSNGIIKNGVLSTGSVKNELLSNGSVKNGVLTNRSVKNGVVSNELVQDKVDSSGYVRNGVFSNGTVQNGVGNNELLQKKVEGNNFVQNGIISNGQHGQNQVESESPESQINYLNYNSIAAVRRRFVNKQEAESKNGLNNAPSTNGFESNMLSYNKYVRDGVNNKYETPRLKKLLKYGLRKADVFVLPCLILWIYLGTHIETYESKAIIALYVGMERIVFSSLFTMLLLCGFTYDGFLRRLAAWHGWQAAGRLVFGLMLLHWTVNLSLAAGRSHTVVTSKVYIAMEWLCTIFFGYLLALPICLLVELPAQKFFNVLIDKF